MEILCGLLTFEQLLRVSVCHGDPSKFSHIEVITRAAQSGADGHALRRELKRIDSLAMSPIFGHFGETLHGLLTLRAFRRQAMFSAHNHQLLDASNRAYWGIQEVRLARRRPGSADHPVQRTHRLAASAKAVGS